MKKAVEPQTLVLGLPPQRKRLSWDVIEPAFKLGILIIGVCLLILALSQGTLFMSKLNSINAYENLFIRGLLLFSLVVFLSSLSFRTYLWFRYRAYDSSLVAATDWPQLTIIVPAYNEGENVYHTIRSIAQCDYPVDKLRVIGIDDGSTDNTLFHLERAQAELPHLVELIKQPHNKGKRQAIYDAYQVARSNSPFIITIDSDTILESSALKEILTPLLLNQAIGAVTGRIKVQNKNANVLTRMMHAHFAMAFDFTRAIQSTFSCVFCLAGAFSAYRVAVLEGIMDRWLHQKFLNTTCTYGEDRSLTNHILREGFGSFFQRTAICHTVIPEKLPKILKMLTRWARSNIRETIVFSTLMFNQNRKGNKLLPFIEYFTTVSLLVLHFIWFYYFLFSGMINSDFILRVITYSIFFGFLYIIYYIRIEGMKDSSYILAFSVFSSIFMIWIFTIAGFTLTKKSWSTR